MKLKIIRNIIPMTFLLNFLKTLYDFSYILNLPKNYK